jgi:hypothetical protein
MSHNKKRNTGFVYEALVKELTKAIVVEKNVQKQKEIRSIMKRYFNPDKPLGRELQLFKALQESIEKQYADKYVNVIKNERAAISESELEQEHSRLINEVNKRISPNVFNNFVSNYKNLATIAQIFSYKTPPKEKMLLEEKLKQDLTKTDSVEENKMDDVTYRVFVDKFNKLYGDNLLREQKELLTRFISSVSDNGVELKLYLNEEIGNLKAKVSKLYEQEEFKNSPQLVEGLNGVRDFLNNFNKKPFDDDSLKKVLKVQELVKEIKLDD